MDTFTILFDLNNLSEELDHLGNVFPDSLEKQENILDSLESLNLDTIDVDSLQSFKINGESVIDSIENTDFSSEVSKDSLNDSSSENFESCKTYISDEATLLCDETNEKDFHFNCQHKVSSTSHLFSNDDTSAFIHIPTNILEFLMFFGHKS